MVQCSKSWRKVSVALTLLFGCGILVTPGLRAQTSAANGKIVGTVYFTGQQPQVHPVSMAKDPVCASMHSSPVMPEDGQVNSNGTLPNAFIYIQSGTGDLSAETPLNPVVIEQKGCEYAPHVVGVMVGQPLEVVNLDPTLHNVQISPKNNPQWNVSQQPGSPSAVRKFQQPEVMIPIRCNVHPWMKAYLAVVSNPYYAVSGNDGSFSIANVPPGTYTLEIWTATFGTQQQKVVVHAGESSPVNFSFPKQ